METTFSFRKPFSTRRKKYCEVCNIKYDLYYTYDSNNQEKVSNKIETGRNTQHKNSDVHKKNQDRSKFYST